MGRGAARGGGQVSIGRPTGSPATGASRSTGPRDGPSSQQTPLSSAHPTVGPQTCPPQGLLSKVTFLPSSRLAYLPSSKDMECHVPREARL